MDLFSYLFALCMAALVVILGVMQLKGHNARIRKRLQPLKPSDQLINLAERPASFLPLSVLRKLNDLFGLTKDTPKMKEVQKQLNHAGFETERALHLYVGLRLGLCLALPMLAWPYLYNQGVSGVFFLVIIYLSFTLGYFLPSIILRNRVEARKLKIREELPDALDLMVVCVEAGQGLNAAMKRVAEELMNSIKHLPREFIKVNHEINAGMKREQALRNLAERTGVDEVASLCNILIQSERFGTSIAQTLKVQSEALRTNRRQKLEERAAKTPVKLVFPLILFIFPAILVVILGPAVIRVADNFDKF